MIDVATLLTGITTADGLLGKVMSKRGTKITKKIFAVTLMQKAINETQIYLVQSQREFIPNQNLSQLWLNAFTAMVSVDKRIAESLRQKSKFWSDPQTWLQQDGAMELIPDLTELNMKCDFLMVELNKRL